MNKVLNFKRPKYLYKYTSISKYSIESIKETYLWFSSSALLNDPFDLKYRFTDKFLKYSFEIAGTNVKNEIKKELKKEGKQLTKNFEVKLDDFFNYLVLNDKFIDDSMNFLLNDFLEYSICCFTERYDNKLMWSHYANKHEGICLIYNFEKDTKIKDRLFPVEYKNEFPNIESPKEDMIALLRKTTDWEYEKEWRIVSMAQGKAKINKKALIGIIFGCNTTRQNKQLVIDACNSLQNGEFKFYQMEKDKYNYKINLTDFEFI